jgi:hypothetical protein
MMQMQAEPTFWARVPAGGWQVGVWVGPDGLVVADVTSPGGTLAYLTSSGTGQADPSIDAGWAGCGAGPDGKRQWWALAIGHASPRLSHVVSFGRHASGRRIERMTLPSEAPSGLWMVLEGLWIAAAVGRYTHVRLTAQSTERIQPLELVAE